MHLKTELARLHNTSHVRRNHCIDPVLLRGFEQLIAELQIMIIEQRVHREIATNPALFAATHDLFKVLHMKGATRTRTHIQLSQTEIDRVCPGIDRSLHRGVATRGCKDFNMRFSGLCAHALKMEQQCMMQKRLTVKDSHSALYQAQNGTSDFKHRMLNTDLATAQFK